MEITLDTKTLKAALYCAATKEDIRHYLIGVFIEVRDGVLFVVSTDGHKLFAYRNDDIVKGLRDCSLILPRETIEVHLKTKDKKAKIKLLGNGRYLLGSQLFDPITATFPDWGRLIPESKDLKEATFGDTFMSTLLTDAEKAYMTQTEEKLHGYKLWQKEKGAVGVIGDNNCICLVIPMILGRIVPPNFKI